jgi:chromosome segregation ATPase
VESENRQSWLLIAIAGLGLVLGVIALIVAFNAKSASDDAATGDSVAEVKTELSNLIDRLGIAEKSLKGEQKELQGQTAKEAGESRNAVGNLSNRVDKAERQIKTLEANEQSSAALDKRVSSLEGEVRSIDSSIANLNQRVTKLTRRVNSGAQASGGESAP